MEAVKEITGGGAHVSIDALGSPETCFNSVANLRKRGKHIQVAYPVEWFKVHTGGKGEELIKNYDTMLNHHYTLLGLVKYKKVPRNRILARVNFNFYMFRDGDGVAYLGNKGTMRMVANPEVVIKGDPCWGFCHEVGHVLQMRPQMTWGGMPGIALLSMASVPSSFISARDRVVKKPPIAGPKPTQTISTSILWRST